MDAGKILCLAPYRFLPAKMGGQKAIDSFYSLLSRAYTVVCISTKNNETNVSRPYVLKPVLSNSFLRYVNVFFLFKLMRIIKKEDPFLLEMEQPYFGWMMIAAKKKSSKPLLIRSHNIEGLRFKTIGKWWWKIMWYYEKWVYQNADYIFFITDEDRKYAIDKMKVEPSKAFTISYSVDWNAAPSLAEKQKSRRIILERHALNENDTLLLFNGAFDYLPNLEALRKLISNFECFSRKFGTFKLLICGKDIPAELVLHSKTDSVIFAGFVPDIEEYYLGADIFLNPIITGGGIKTKLVEALANDLNCVSFENGAIGIDPGWCNGKLIVIKNGQWNLFFEAIHTASGFESTIGSSFFDHFSSARQLEKIKNIF